MLRQFYLSVALLFCGGISIATQVFADPITHGMGAIPSTTVKAAPIPLPGGGAIPSVVDLRLWAVPVGNQGGVGSCVAWAIAHALMGWQANRVGASSSSFAPMYMYSQINGGVDNGSNPITAINLLIGQGNDTRAHYIQGDDNWSHSPTNEEIANAANFRFFKSYQTLFSGGAAGTNGSLAIRTALANEQPVAITLPVRDGFNNLSPTSTLDTDTTSTIIGWHEVLAIGYDSQGLLVQNSWGTGWGSDGYGRLAWSVVESDVAEASVLIPGQPQARSWFVPIGNLLLR